VSNIVELRDGLSAQDLAEVTALAPAGPGDSRNWVLIVVLLACLCFWAGVAAGIYLVVT
jgi:hypothetical protein